VCNSRYVFTSDCLAEFKEACRLMLDCWTYVHTSLTKQLPVPRPPSRRCLHCRTRRHSVQYDVAGEEASLVRTTFHHRRKRSRQRGLRQKVCDVTTDDRSLSIVRLLCVYRDLSSDWTDIALLFYNRSLV